MQLFYCFDDIPISGSRLIALTTIQHPVQEMARTACRRMVERIRNGALAPTTRDVLPTRLVQRNTTASLRTTPRSSAADLPTRPAS